MRSKTVAVLDGFSVGEGGRVVTIVCRSRLGAVQDWSSLSGTNKIYMTSPDQTRTISADLSATSDSGADGQLQFVLVNTDLDRAGDWLGQIQFGADTSSTIFKSEIFVVRVAEGLA